MKKKVVVDLILFVATIALMIAPVVFGSVRAFAEEKLLLL